MKDPQSLPKTQQQRTTPGKAQVKKKKRLSRKDSKRGQKNDRICLKNTY